MEQIRKNSPYNEKCCPEHSNSFSSVSNSYYTPPTFDFYNSRYTPKNPNETAGDECFREIKANNSQRTETFHSNHQNGAAANSQRTETFYNNHQNGAAANSQRTATFYGNQQNGAAANSQKITSPSYYNWNGRANNIQETIIMNGRPANSQRMTFYGGYWNNPQETNNHSMQEMRNESNHGTVGETQVYNGREAKSYYSNSKDEDYEMRNEERNPSKEIVPIPNTNNSNVNGQNSDFKTTFYTFKPSILGFADTWLLRPTTTFGGNFFPTETLPMNMAQMGRQPEMIGMRQPEMIRMRQPEMRQQETIRMGQPEMRAIMEQPLNNNPFDTLYELMTITREMRLHFLNNRLRRTTENFLGRSSETIDEKKRKVETFNEMRGIMGNGAKTETYLEISQKNTSDSQNSHDTAVNASEKVIFNRLREEQKTLKLANIEQIRNYYKRDSQNFTADPRTGKSRPHLMEKVLIMLTRAIFNNEYCVSVEAYEAEVIQRVWLQTDHPLNKENSKKMKQALFDTFVDSWENEKLQCVNGRIGRILGSLALLDYNTLNWNITRSEQIKNEIFQRTGEIIRIAAIEAAESEDPRMQKIGQSYFAQTPEEFHKIGMIDKKMEKKWIESTKEKISKEVDAHISSVIKQIPNALPPEDIKSLKEQALAAL